MFLKNGSKLFLLTLLMLSLSACGPKPTKGGKSNELYEVFYAGLNGGPQYFIRPLSFIAVKGQEFSVDFSIRDANFDRDSTIMNYTIISDEQFDPNQAIDIIDEKRNLVYSFTAERRMFQEKYKTSFLARFSTTIPNEVVDKIFGIGFFQFKTSLPSGDEVRFWPETNTVGHIKQIEKRIFTLY